VQWCSWRWCFPSRRQRLGWRWGLLLLCSGARGAGAAPRGGIGLDGDGCCCCYSATRMVQYCSLRSAAPRGGIGLVGDGCCCCCYSAAVLVALVLLLADASARLVMWCCCCAVVLVALVLLLAEASGCARWVLLLLCSGSRRAGAAPRGGIGLVGDVVVLLLCSSVRRAGVARRGGIGLVGNGCCCCCSMAVLVALVLLLAEASAWLAIRAAAIVQWCSLRWCCSSRRHRLSWR
jgi:hypothetical protein